MSEARTDVPLTAWIDGVALFAPGLAGWPAGRHVLSGGSFVAAPTEIPKLAVLPPAERRRVGTVVRLALATGLAACESASARCPIGGTWLTSSWESSPRNNVSRWTRP